MVRARKPRMEDAPSTGYGDEAALLESLSQVGMPGGPQQTWISPDEVPNLDDDTADPDEPLTAGLDIGDGPGPEVLGAAMQTSPVRRTLQAMLEYGVADNQIMRLIDQIDARGR